MVASGWHDADDVINANNGAVDYKPSTEVDFWRWLSESVLQSSDK